jgi:hypothetical protein
MMAERPSKEEWKSWIRDRITQQFLSDVQDEREDVKELIVQGKGPEQIKEMIGSCLGMQWVLDYAIRDFNYREKGAEEEYAKSIGVSDSSETERS